MLELGLRFWLAPLAGVRPGGRPTFLSRDKKVGKEARPALPTTLRFATGDLILEVRPAHGRTRLRAQGLCARTTAVSQMLKF